MKRIMEQQWDEQIYAMAKEDTHPDSAHLEQRLAILGEHLNDVQPVRRRRSWKRLAMTAAAIACIASISVYAAGKTFVLTAGSSSEADSYTSLPTAEQCIDDVGYAPILLEQFANGYAFAGGDVLTDTLKSDGNEVKNGKSVDFYYEKGGDEVILSQIRDDLMGEDNSGYVICEENGVEYRYSSFINKTVPEGYQMTEEDKAKEASGEIVFNEGSDTVEENSVQGLSWSDGDMRYGLTQINGNLTQDELLDMAQELMAQ